MKNNRIVDHPVLGKLEDRKEITFTFDGKEYTGFEGDTVASALLAHGIRTLRVHEESKKPRSIYCNIGHCYECRVTVDDVRGVRACLTPIREGMAVDSGKGLPSPLNPSIPPEELPRTYAEYEEKSKETRGDTDA
ncbi:MAG TPA: (2Fe-2S)-binding protein [Bacillota bacterium]|nr:(2Fe-2S)-binding protein [Bacillota bacterium]